MQKSLLYFKKKKKKSPKGMIHERRTDRPDFVKNFCSAKDTVKKMKKQATNWEKKSAKDISDKKLLSTILQRPL